MSTAAPRQSDYAPRLSGGMDRSRGRFFKTLSEGLLAALPGYKGPDVKNNQKWLFRRRSADQPRSAKRIACQIAHRMLRRSRYRRLTAETSVVRLGSNQRRVVRRDGRGVPRQLRFRPVRAECRTGSQHTANTCSSRPSDVLRHAMTR